MQNEPLSFANTCNPSGGYFGIVLVDPQVEANVGTLLRTAFNFGASFIATVGEKYFSQVTDTVKTPRNVPLFHFENWATFLATKPDLATLVAVERSERAVALETFTHPRQATYVFGSEDRPLSDQHLAACQFVVSIGTRQALNLAVCGAVVMYDRQLKKAAGYTD